MRTSTRISEEQFALATALANRLNAADDSTPDDLNCGVAEHPEGRKRGGVVAIYEENGVTVMYDEIDCSWVEYDEIE